MTYLETKVFRLSTLSPIHIQAGEPDVYGQGFIRLNNSDDFLYVVDIPKLQAEIFAFKGLEAVETYTKAYSNPRSKTNITTVLKRIGYDYKANIEKISKSIVRLPGGHRFIRSGLGKHYVPGSSIKGAIKTAVLYDIVKKGIDAGNLDLNQFVDDKINAYLDIQYPSDPDRQDSEQKDFKRDFAQERLRDAFQSTRPWEQIHNPQRNNQLSGPFKDVFRSIKVKDATLTSIDPSRFAKPIRLSTSGRSGITLHTLDRNEIYLPYNNLKGTLKMSEWIRIDTFEEVDGEQTVGTYMIVDKPTYSEVKFNDVLFTTLEGNQIVEKDVGGNTRYEGFYGETTIEISIDKDILESFKRGGADPPFKDLKELLRICKNFAQAQWEAEQEFFQTYSNSGSVDLEEIKAFYNDAENKQSATLRVGWGTGMLGTTISLLLDEATRVKVRNEVISDDGEYRPKPAPKSRRFVLENKLPVYPLGWIKIKE